MNLAYHQGLDDLHLLLRLRVRIPELLQESIQIVRDMPKIEHTCT